VDSDRTSDLDVAALIERARAGQADAYQALFRLHVARVHRLVHRLAGASPDLDDLVQTVFVEGFRSLPAFRGEALFSTWLGRIAVRVVSRHRRRPALRLVPLPDDDDAPLRRDTPGPELGLDASRRLAQLDALLAALSDKRRAAFVLHVLEGYPVEEVAAMLGASVSAVKVRVHDARREIERRARRDPLFASFFSGEGNR
jgi:RNA polymerase sigma factor (sigma-70 family)